MKFVHIFSFCLTIAVLIYNVNSLEAESIVGGNDASSGQLKYQVSVQRHNTPQCGGGIIGDRHIITAAHCVLTKDNKFINDRWYVVADTINAIHDRGQVVEVEKIFIRKDFRHSMNLEKPSDDIAVLKLKSSLDTDANHRIDKLSLPSADETYGDTTAVIAGFGYTQVQTRYDHRLKRPVHVSGYTDYDLKFAEANVLSNQKCGEFHGQSIHDSALCASVKQRNKYGEGTCSGDSGSPLVHNGNVVIGILSNSPGACKETKSAGPGIYARVSYYLSFIENAIKDKKTNDMRAAVIKTESSWFSGTTTTVQEI